MPQATSDPRLAPLSALLGEWQIAAALPNDPDTVTRGRASFEWLKGRISLVQRFEMDHPDFPDGIQIIGRDEASAHFTAHYFDSRGVSRIYQMSLRDGVWTIWRDWPDFSQRFTGTFGDNGNTISAAWESSRDGTTWEHDFDLTYTRVMGEGGRQS